MNDCKTERVSDEAKLYSVPIIDIQLFVEQDILTFSVSGDPDAEPDFKE